METIEERANYFVGSPFRMGETVRETYQRNGYIVGAHDQRGIDVERACEWFEKYLADIGYPDDWAMSIIREYRGRAEARASSMKYP